MPSAETGLDSRRLKDVKPRELAGEDWSDGNFKHRVQRRRLIELIGEEATEQFYRDLATWRKAWEAKPIEPSPW